MKLLFLYGQPATGKLTVARKIARLTGFGVFHNHLVVDAVAAVFPFGSDPFVRLREQLWLTVMAEAARRRRSLVFTFQPEPTVAAGFAACAREAVEQEGGEVVFVRLVVDSAEQERRLALPSRLEFDKMRSPELLRRLRPDCARCEAAMPEPAMTVDTGKMSAAAAAVAIRDQLELGRS